MSTKRTVGHGGFPVLSARLGLSFARVASSEWLLEERCDATDVRDGWDGTGCGGAGFWVGRRWWRRGRVGQRGRTRRAPTSISGWKRRMGIVLWIG